MYSADVISLYELIMSNGMETEPRGLKIKELLYTKHVIVNPWSSMPARNMNMDYIKREMQWFLTANPYDDRICKHAKMWPTIMQEDRRIFSNYGYYWFAKRLPDQMTSFDWVVNTLKLDPDSRQAYIPMLAREHMFIGNKDYVCTKGIHFMIRGDALHMHVDMRSSDAVYGIHTDLPMFTWLHQMLCQALQIDEGRFIFSTDSLHVYEKHWDMVNQCIEENKMYVVDHPSITDPYDLIDNKFESPFGQWLKEAPL